MVLTTRREFWSKDNIEAIKYFDNVLRSRKIEILLRTFLQGRGVGMEEMGRGEKSNTRILRPKVYECEAWSKPRFI